MEGTGGIRRRRHSTGERKSIERRHHQSISINTGERKSIERRRSRSQTRKSGPKLVLVARDGREERRRLSGTNRRDSKSKAVTRRRERSELRPPLPGHSVIGRASLPGRLSAPAVAPRPLQEPGLVDTTSIISGDHDREIEPMQQDEQEINSEAMWTPEMVNEAARGVLGGDKQLQLRSLRWLRGVLSLAPKPPAAEVVRAGLIPKFIALLRGPEETPELRPEALCALTNIASTECTRAVVQEPDAIPTLKALLSSPDSYLREQSAWCLGNIAADGVEMRDLVLSAGVLDPLLQSLAPSPHPSTTITRTGTWALNNLCRGLPPSPLAVVLPILAVIRPVIAAAGTGDAGTLIDAGWVLYHVTRGGTDRIDALLSEKLLPLMPDLLLHENPQVVRPAIRAMDNLACSSGAHRGALIAAGVLDPLVETLGNESAKVRSDALRLISCIAAGSSEQVDAVASTTDLIPSVVAELEEGNALCRQEAAWVFLNIVECGLDTHDYIIPEMVAHGVIPAVCHNLDTTSDVESLVVMLSLLYTLLDDGGLADNGSRLSEYVTLVEEAEGFDRTVNLMNDHDDMEVYDKATDIVRCFMDLTVSEDGDEHQAELGLSTPPRIHVEDPDPDSMSEDSLSDDSFHPELSSTTGPITPPHLSKAAPRTPPSATVTNDSGVMFGGGRTDAVLLDVRGVGVGKTSRQPLGAVADASVGKNYSNFAGNVDGTCDVSSENSNWKTGCCAVVRTLLCLLLQERWQV